MSSYSNDVCVPVGDDDGNLLPSQAVFWRKDATQSNVPQLGGMIIDPR